MKNSKLLFEPNRALECEKNKQLRSHWCDQTFEKIKFSVTLKVTRLLVPCVRLKMHVLTERKVSNRDARSVANLATLSLDLATFFLYPKSNCDESSSFLDQL